MSSPERLTTSNNRQIADNDSSLSTVPVCLTQSLTSVCNDPRAWHGVRVIQPTPAIDTSDPSGVLFSRAVHRLRKRLPQDDDSWRTFAEGWKQAEVVCSKVEHPLSVVPAEFFEAGFSLRDPSTVERVYDMQPNREAGTWSPELVVTRLSHWLDLIEIKLIEEISTRSPVFFQAVGTLHRLKDQVASVCFQLETLRQDLQNLDDVVALGSLQVPRLLLQRRALQRIYQQLRLASTLRQSLKAAKHASRTGDFAGSLALTNVAEEALAESLRGLSCFRFLRQGLTDVSRLAASRAEDAFLLNSLVKACERSGRKTVKETYGPIVDALIRTGPERFQLTLQRYRELLFISIRYSVGWAVAWSFSMSVPEAELGGSELADESFVGRPPPALCDDLIQSVSPSEFSSLLQPVFSAAIMRLRSAAAVYPVVLLALRRLEGVTDVDLEEPVTPAVHSWNSLLRSACELAQSQVARLIETRTKQHERLSLEEISALYHSCMRFLLKAEALTGGHMCSSLRQTFLHQLKAFLDAFHARALKKIILALENDRWTQAPVPVECQSIVDTFLDISSTEREARLTTKTSLYVSQVEYKVSASFFSVVHLLQDYFNLAQKLPLLVPEVVHRVVEMLQLYNRRTSELILGAEAIELLHLKSISTKLLAIAAQTLTVLAALIPFIRSALSELLGQASHHSLLFELDGVARSCDEHVTQIFSKIVTIVKERVKLHLGAGRAAQEYGAVPPSSRPVTSLERDLAALHRILLACLPANQLRSVFAAVVEALDSDTAALIADLESRTLVPFQEDFSHLQTTLLDLKGIDSPEFPEAVSALRLKVPSASS